MKTQNNRYQNPTLEAVLKYSFEENKEQVKIDTESVALKNLPRISGDRMQSYFEEPHLRSQLLLDKVNAELQFKTVCQEVSEQEKLSEQQTKALGNKLSEVKEKQIPVNSKCKNTPYPISRIQLILAHSAVIILCLSEATFTTPVFESLGFSFIAAVLMSLFFGAALTILAHTVLRIVNLGRTIWHRRIIAITFLLLLFGVFKYMADIRAEYLSNAVNTNTEGVLHIYFSPWPFVLTSMLLFIVAVAVCHFYMPTKEQKDALREYCRLNKEKKAVEDEISQIEGKINAVQQETSDLKNTNASILVYGAMLEEQIINNARSCYALWKKHNLMHRPDNCRPSCFDDPYPFSFNTNFHTIKSMNHDTNIM